MKRAIAVANQRWLFASARTEAADGCPRLFAIKDPLPMYFREVTADWTTERRYNLLMARIKSVRISLELPLPALTPEEEAAQAAFDYPINEWHRDGKSAVPFVWALTGITQIVDVEKLGEAKRRNDLDTGKYKINRRALQANVDRAMKPVFGKPEQSSGPERVYWASVGDFCLRTTADFGARTPTQMRLEHQLWKAPWQERIAYLQGVRGLLGTGEWEWRYLTDADVPQGADLAARLCKDFLEAMPKILDAARQISSESGA